MTTMNIKFFMNKAISEANKAFSTDEVPVGAVLVDNKSQQIITSACNSININNDATQHAEIVVIQESCKKLCRKYLTNTSIFVTLEPCVMCAAAISEAHIDKIYFGAYDEKKGSLESIMKIYNTKNYFVPEVYGGINETECSMILKKFFQEKR